MDAFVLAGMGLPISGRGIAVSRGRTDIEVSFLSPTFYDYHRRYRNSPLWMPFENAAQNTGQASVT